MKSTTGSLHGAPRDRAETWRVAFGARRFRLVFVLGWLAMAAPEVAAAPHVPAARSTGAGAPLALVQATDMVLHEVAAAGDMELAVYLLEQGAEVDVRSAIDASTPLHVAAHAGRIEVVRLLIAKGADIGARAQGGATPMHMAALGGHAEIVELLLSRGADVNVTTSSTSTPLHLAAREGHAKLVELLLRHGAEIESRRAHFLYTPLMDAAHNGHVEVVAVLLRNGADLKPRSMETSTALGLARAAGHAAVADLLQRHGATE
jgi:ankyrin repeat protein